MSNPLPVIWSLMIDGFSSRYFDVSEAISGEFKGFNRGFLTLRFHPRNQWLENIFNLIKINYEQQERCS